jgi:hypothetical protein
MQIYGWAGLALAACVAFSHQSGGASCRVQLPAGSNFAPVRSEDWLVVYRNGFEVDIDGAPNAYHVTGSNRPPAGGLEHICSGADLYDVRDGQLVNRYPNFAVPGSSEHCRVDYLALKEAGFPPCSTGKCIRFYGVVSSNRACGFPPHVNDQGCGVPVQQRSEQDQPLDFYVSATSWHRSGAAPTDQSAYLDARYVPYLVYDRSRLEKLGINLKDLALVAWQGRATFAIYGDGASHLNEASVATLNRLHGKADTDQPNWHALVIETGATIVAFPNSAGLVDAGFPAKVSPGASATPAKQVIAAGQEAVRRAGGSDAILGCLGLTNEDPIVTE